MLFPSINRILALAAATGIFASSSFAEEVPENFGTVGAAGMGGAHTAVAQDEDAIWTNPAGISRSRKAHSRDTVHVFRFPNMILGANADSRSFIQMFRSSKDKSVEEIIESSESLGQKPLWVRAAVFPAIVLDIGQNDPAAFALFSNTTSKIVIDREAPTEARVSTISDQGAVLSYAFTAEQNRATFGIQLRPLYRYAFENTIPSDDLVDREAMKEHLTKDSNSSTGIGIDMGVLFTLADFWFPTLGVSIMNLPTGCKDDYLNPFTEMREKVCGTKFAGDLGNPDALSVIDPMDLRVGFAITPRLGRDLSLRFAFDMQNLYIPAGETYYGLQGIEAKKLMHAGAELFIGNPLELSPFSVKAGLNQGFFSYGVGTRLGFIGIDFASYGRDISSSAKTYEDRRYVGSITGEF